MWVKLINSGYLPSEKMDLAIRHKTIELVNKSKKPTRISTYGEEKIVDAIVANIEADSRVLGSVVVLECNKPFEPLDMRIMALLRDIATIEISRNQKLINAKGKVYEYFMQNLLEGKVTDANEIEERIKYLEIEIRDIMFIISIFIDVGEQKNVPYEYHIERIQRTIPNSKGIVYNGNIVLFVSRKRNFDKDEFSVLEPYLRSHNMYGVVSNPLNNIKEISNGYKQNLVIYKMTGQFASTNLFYSRDHIFQHVISTISNKNELINICHPSAIHLYKYDKERNMNYTDSLYAYLKFNRKITPTARYLFVHKNTVSYRIEKISQIINIDWDDGEELFNIFFSIKILKYIEEQTGKKQ
jgi:sugar diacid utilization regulator